MESNADDQIKTICETFGIQPMIIGQKSAISLTNSDFEKNTVNVIVDYKVMMGQSITKDMHNKGILPENLQIELL